MPWFRGIRRTKMLRERIGFAWKILPSWMRLRIIRLTQQKFTVSVAAIVTEDSGKVLLLRHVLRPFSEWGLPGGFLSANEQPEDGVRRELREETCLELTDLKLFRIRTVRRHVEMLFSAHAVGEARVASSEIFELGWFDLDSMPSNMSRAQKTLISEVLAR